MKIALPQNIEIKKHAGFWKQIGMIIIGTTISLVLTISASMALELRERANDRRLSALMVMGTIEDFANGIEEIVESQMRCDSLCVWLLSVPVDELELMPKETLADLTYDAMSNSFVSFDKAAENIFSNNLETWKNLGNFQFINNVGDCFTRMHNIEEYWNNRVKEEEKALDEISGNPGEYPGKYTWTKWLRNDNVRQAMAMKHNWNCWLHYQAEYMRYTNKQNMSVIGITEKELKEFMEEYHKEIVIEEQAPVNDDFYTPFLEAKDLYTLEVYQKQLDSIKAHQ
jgi:hypothetical protein